MRFEDTAEGRVLRDMPEKYASIAYQVDLAMDLSHRPCVGGECDGDGSCPRHSRTGQVVSRYLRLKRRKRS